MSPLLLILALSTVNQNYKYVPGIPSPTAHLSESVYRKWYAIASDWEGFGKPKQTVRDLDPHEERASKSSHHAQTEGERIEASKYPTLLAAEKRVLKLHWSQNHDAERLAIRDILTTHRHAPFGGVDFFMERLAFTEYVTGNTVEAYELATVCAEVLNRRQSGWRLDLPQRCDYLRLLIAIEMGLPVPDPKPFILNRLSYNSRFAYLRSPEELKLIPKITDRRSLLFNAYLALADWEFIDEDDVHNHFFLRKAEALFPNNPSVFLSMLSPRQYDEEAFKTRGRTFASQLPDGAFKQRFDWAFR